ncbi:Hypothetical_protein [Hexamita inflata]|uniref:Hypothetical_protein n=1 Tax=Hexamita inflata TaxID=28002 RepID=A0AA86PKX4_9EUKA|nr:Hypothetical protein HINF_LOCUS28018 [Hexamita inflata]
MGDFTEKEKNVRKLFSQDITNPKPNNCFSVYDAHGISTNNALAKIKQLIANCKDKMKCQHIQELTIVLCVGQGFDKSSPANYNNNSIRNRSVEYFSQKNIYCEYLNESEQSYKQLTSNKPNKGVIVAFIMPDFQG